MDYFNFETEPAESGLTNIIIVRRFHSSFCLLSSVLLVALHTKFTHHHCVRSHIIYIDIRYRNSQPARQPTYVVILKMWDHDADVESSTTATAAAPHCGRIQKMVGDSPGFYSINMQGMAWAEFAMLCMVRRGTHTHTHSRSSHTHV